MWFQPFSNIWKLSSFPICIRSLRLVPKYTSAYLRCFLDRWGTANIYFINKVHSYEAGYNTGKRRYGTHLLYEKSNDLWMSIGNQYARLTWL